jgi:hypothetical protein
MFRSDEVRRAFEEHLHKLDQAPIGQDAVFENQHSRERYESLITFTFHKLLAAKYHLEQVEALLDSERLSLDRFAAQTESQSESISAVKPYKTMLTSSRLREEPAFGYELVAFVAAIKTGLDFMATAAAIHFKGVKCDSIRMFLRRAEQNNSDPFSNCVSRHMDWIENIRDYRHHLLHRLIVRTQSGGRISVSGGKSAKVIYPVVVPTETPRGCLDTRRIRSFEATLDDVQRIDISESYAYVEYPDGRTEALIHEIGATPARGYERVEDFMHRHIEAFAEFFQDAITSLHSNAFEAKLKP